MKKLFLIFLFVSHVTADCQSCVAGLLQSWCYETSTCGIIHLFCPTVISDEYVCPQPVPSGYEYTDDFARNTALPYIVAAYSSSPSACLTNQVPTAQLDQQITVSCGNNPLLPGTCTAITAVDNTTEAIIVSFKGSADTQQIIAQLTAVLQPSQSFFNHGKVYGYFYDGFMALWNGGLQARVQALKAAHPTYDLWVFGHSLGAAEASIFASYAIETGVYTADQVKLLTFGQPRTGDKDFAKWHDETFYYSYRVVHKNDAISQLPPKLLGYWHHRYQVWYNNDMTSGSNFTVCLLGDGSCTTSNGASWDDHNVYFTRNLAEWAAVGCPNN